MCMRIKEIRSKVSETQTGQIQCPGIRYWVILHDKGNHSFNNNKPIEDFSLEFYDVLLSFLPL